VGTANRSAVWARRTCADFTRLSGTETPHSLQKWPIRSADDRKRVALERDEYRGISLIRNSAPLGPCSSNMPRALGGGAVSCERGTPVHLERFSRFVSETEATFRPGAFEMVRIHSGAGHAGGQRERFLN
jgi:hypothetical protein